MSARGIFEHDGKRLLREHISPFLSGHFKRPDSAQIRINKPSSDANKVPILDPASPTINFLNKEDSLLEERCILQDLLIKEYERVEAEYPWIRNASSFGLVVKPDQLLKRRGKAGLVGINLSWPQVKEWISQRTGMEMTINNVTGNFKSFIIEPFIEHVQEEEFYVCIQSKREGDEILFVDHGGMDVGDVESKAIKYLIPSNECFLPTNAQLVSILFENENAKKRENEGKGKILSPATKAVIAEFIGALLKVYMELHFTYLEINPFLIREERGKPENGFHVHVLDLAAKLDQTASFEMNRKWGNISFPAPFGRDLTPEEAYIAELDSKTGASLKLTILNPHGRIWTMVAGGGASVAYADAISSLGYANELANYGEYSGAPNETQTFEYAKTILDLMTRDMPHPQGKILIIGGGIANFTNVATTFKGIITALQKYKHKLIQYGVSIWVRRGGPNYQEGLRMMRELGDVLGVPINVYGPETHITAIVSIAIDHHNRSKSNIKEESSIANGENEREREKKINENEQKNATISTFDKEWKNNAKDSTSCNGINTRTDSSTGNNGIGNSTGSNSKNFLEQFFTPAKPDRPERNIGTLLLSEEHAAANVLHFKPPTPIQFEIVERVLFTKSTRAFVYGMQPKAIQSMLDFDYICKRSSPSVAAMIYPFGGEHVQKFYWGGQETLIPVYTCLDVAIKRHGDVDIVVNFASCRSVLESCKEIMASRQIKTVAIIAEGVPERHTKKLISMANESEVTLIGPATVGGLRGGSFKIGNTGGMIDNIVSSRLYRPGNVCYVSKSGGMSNELNNIISQKTNGVLEGIAIGGDRYPGTGFLEHVLRYEKDSECQLIVLLGEVGGTEEYRLIDSIKRGEITKPIIGWCIGICAGLFGAEVQFGHAGACAGSQNETAEAKNKALREVGVLVPNSFEEMPDLIERTFNSLVAKGVIVMKPEPSFPKVPIDYAWAQELGLIRKPAAFVSTICDDRGQELLYAGMPISAVFKEEIGIGGVMSLLWFKRRLPTWACKFIEMVLMLTADHGPAVSGAHNTIVAARAAKDLVSSLASGLLTIGERFGGALDGAAEQFTFAFDQNLTPNDFVDQMRKEHKLILGIGHRIKSKTNPDLRVTLLKEYARNHFPANSTPLLDYALKVEEITTQKKDNLILNVDGCIAVLFVDLLRNSKAFTQEEAEEYIKIGTLNGLFVLGRSIGFIGHYLDQKRLKQGLYRHPWDDISYLSPALPNSSSISVSLFHSPSPPS